MSSLLYIIIRVFLYPEFPSVGIADSNELKLDTDVTDVSLFIILIRKIY